MLEQGVSKWNEWRDRSPYLQPDLSEIDLWEQDLSNINLERANLRRAHLRKCNLPGARFFMADLNGAWLIWSDLTGADFGSADLTGANLASTQLSTADLNHARLAGASLSQARLDDAVLRGADLTAASLTSAFLTRADMSYANLECASLVHSCLHDANLTHCRVYGVSAWDVELSGARQSDLIITEKQWWDHETPMKEEEEQNIMVDSLEVAQFIHLLVHNERIRHVVDAITSKVVLILGRFGAERKPILNVIKDELRKRGYLPILFDSRRPSSRDLTETVSVIAHMSRFIIADITDARSVPQELQAIVPNLPSVAVLPLLQSGKEEYGLYEHFKRYPWVLGIYRYRGIDDLVLGLGDNIIPAVEAKVVEIRSC